MKRLGTFWYTSFFVVLIFSLFFGLFTNIYISKKATSVLEDSFYTICKGKGNEVDSVLKNVSLKVDTVSDAILTSFPDLEKMKDPEYLEMYFSRTEKYLSRTFGTIPGISSYYYRLAPEISDSYVAGIWKEKFAGSFRDLEVTDLSAFPESDLQHVGWYFVPKSMGRPVWLEPYYNKSVYVFMFSYIVPIYVEGSFVGVVGVDVELKDIATMIQNLQLYKSGYAILLSKDGRELSSRPLQSKKSYAQYSYHLVNDMTLAFKVPSEEVFPVNKGFLLTASIVFYSLLFVLTFAVITRKFYKRTHITRHQREISYYSIVRFILLFMFACIIIAQSVLVMVKSGIFTKNPEIDIRADNCYEETLKVAVDYDFRPYSYYEDGKVTGHDIELMNEIANRLKMNVEYYMLPWDDAKKDCAEGRIDAIMALETLESEKTPGIIRSDSYFADKIVVIGKQDVKSVINFKNYKIASLESLRQYDIYGLLNNAQMFTDFEGVIDALESGACDYGVVRMSVAKIIINSSKYYDLYQVFDLMESFLGIGISSGNEELCSRINSVLAQMEKEGVIDEINAKWITVRNYKYSVGTIIKENSSFFFITYVFLGLILFVLLSIRMFIKVKKEELEKDQFKNLSRIDHLTGVYNRGYGEKLVGEKISSRESGAFLLLDIDHFKQINDTCGHLIGDKALISISTVFKEECRENDILLRLGGDEFVAYVPGVSTRDSLVPLIGRLFNRLESIKIPELGEKKITVSIGVAFFDGNEEENFVSLYKKSDKAAYSSKNIAGNTVTYAD